MIMNDEGFDIVKTCAICPKDKGYKITYTELCQSISISNFSVALTKCNNILGLAVRSA